MGFIIFFLTDTFQYFKLGLGAMAKGLYPDIII